MTLSVRSRFEVFKRDGFTCGYCGKTPDDEGVKLEVDHITPRANGGGDELTNLITSCWDCNHGKAAVPLGDKAPSLTVAMANTRERALQLDEYRKWQNELDDVSGAIVRRVWDEWIAAFNGEKTRDESGTTWRVPYIGVPSKQSLMRHIDDGSEVETVLQAIEKTRRRWLVTDGHLPDLADGDVQRYFFGTLKRMREDRTSTRSSACSGDCGYQLGEDNGTYLEHRRLGKILKNWRDQGFESLEDAVLAMWPED